jgi:hypothetical protein
MTILKDIYKAIFGKDYSFIWKQFASDVDGKYLPNSEDKVEFIYKGYKILFDSYTHYTVVGESSYEKEYVRGIAEFISPDNLKLKLIPQGLIENIGKFFGSQDITIGDKLFDKKYIIKGNDDYKAQLVLSNNSIKKTLMEQNIVRLEITDSEGLFDEKVQEGNSMIYYVTEEKITHIDQLNNLKTLFVDLIDQLTKNNSAKPLKAIN